MNYKPADDQHTVDEEKGISIASLHDKSMGLMNEKGLNMMVVGGYKPYDLVYIDIDEMGEINKTYGRDAGTKIINNLVKMVQECNDVHTVKRYGGDEFLVKVKKGFGAKVVKEIDAKVKIHKPSFSVSMGIGDKMEKAIDDMEKNKEAKKQIK